MKLSQNMRILEYIKRHGGITSLEASDVLRITRLSARICDLRRMGYPIAIKYKLSDDGARYGYYYLSKDGEQDG